MAQQFSGLLRREFRFLHNPLNVWSRLCLLAAAVTIAVSIFFPLGLYVSAGPERQEPLALSRASARVAGELELQNAPG